MRHSWQFISLKMLKQGMTEDLFDLKEIYFIEISEIRYGWEFISLKDQNKVRLGFILLKKSK